jgi:hypothetical protein
MFLAIIVMRGGFSAVAFFAQCFFEKPKKEFSFRLFEIIFEHKIIPTYSKAKENQSFNI